CAQLVGQFPKFVTQAIANLFAAKHNAPKILAVHTLLGRLVQQMIKERRDAYKRVGFEFSQVTNIAVGPHDFAATGAQDKDATSGPSVVRQPECQVWGKREGVQETILAFSRADFDNPAACNSQVCQVPLRIEERRRVCASPRGKGDENRSKFRL